LTILGGSDAWKIPDVPYFAQWESAELVPSIISGAMRASQDPLWARSGADSPAEYEFWSWRACGVACLRMLLKWWKGETPAALPLVRECRDAGAYVANGNEVRGLIYAPFCRYLGDRWNLDARVVTGVELPELAGLLSEQRLAILSVHPSIREVTQPPPERGGHLVLAVAGSRDELILHNPSGLPGRSQRFAAYSLGTLSRYFAGRGMIISHV